MPAHPTGLYVEAFRFESYADVIRSYAQRQMD
jgi:hypothetical protein